MQRNAGRAHRVASTFFTIALGAGTLALSPATSATPALAATAPARTVRTASTVVGTLEVLHADDWAHNRARHYYDIVTAGGEHVTLQTKSHFDRLSGRAVRFSGVRDGDTLSDPKIVSVGALTRTASTATSPITPVVGTKRIGVLLMNFTDLPSQPQTVAQDYATFFGPTNSVADFYHSTSDGQLTLTGDVYGWYTVPYASTSCQPGNWATAAKAQATAAGVNLAQYDYLVYVHPAIMCGYGGLGVVGGSGAWINSGWDGSVLIGTVAHELGHNFGAYHASSFTCTDPAQQIVALSPTCTRYEYGDTSSVMGSGLNFAHDAPDAWLYGWIKGETIDSAGTYQLVRRHTAGTGPQVLRVRRNSTQVFDLELRAVYGPYDNFPPTVDYVNGVTIRLDNTDSRPTPSY
jgi:hypothetical protein